MDAIKKTTAIIKTFERPRSLWLLLESMRAMYPDLEVIVGDDSFGKKERKDNQKACETYNARYVAFPKDIGLSFGRNRLLERVETPFFLLLDDDFVFTEKTRVEELVERVDKYGLDIVAGSVEMDGMRKHYEGIFDYRGNELHSIARSKGRVGDVYLYDLVFNFFAGRTKTVSFLGWTDELKLAEHTDFFFRARDLLSVGYYGDVEVTNSKAVPSELYRSMRGRGKKFTVKFMQKHRLKKIVNVHGQAFEI